LFVFVVEAFEDVGVCQQVVGGLHASPTDRPGLRAQSAMSRWSIANSTNSRRFETPSLVKVLDRWCLTVSTLIAHRFAMVLVEWPAITHSTICSSREVSPNLFLAVRALELGARRR